MYTSFEKPSSENLYADAAPTGTVFHGAKNRVIQMTHSRLPRASFVMEKATLHPVAHKTRAKEFTQTVVVASYAERLLI